MKRTLKTLTRYQAFLLASAFLLLLTTYQSANAFKLLLIDNVNVDKTTITPESNDSQKALISYRLTKNAEVTILIIDPDYQPIRILLNGSEAFKGVNSVEWDGRDDNGNVVPNEAYLFTITAISKDGETKIYDPTAVSGGEVLISDSSPVELKEGSTNVPFSLTKSGRVRIRAGVLEGPMYKTILDWTPFPAGEHEAAWDGMDETGKIFVPSLNGFAIVARAFALPENSIIVKGGGDYFEYKKLTKTKLFKSSSINEKVFSPTPSTVRTNVSKRSGYTIDQQYLIPRSINRSPKFTVSSGSSSTKSSPAPSNTSQNTVSGTIPLTVELDPDSESGMISQRFEIVIYVDDKRFDEEEQGYSPFTYMLDTTKIANGEHLITINVPSLTDQVGTTNFTLNVLN